MKVLFAVWELDPFIKVGGLGDVARSLPAALKKNNIDIRIVLPYYKTLKLKRYKRTKVAKFTCIYDGKEETVDVFLVYHPTSKVPVYLLQNKSYLSLASIPDTFAFFSKAIVKLCEKNILSWIPDIIHCNDNHTGFVPLLIREKKLPIKTMLTIHNLAYQGTTSTRVLERLGIDESKCRVIGWETERKQVNLLMEGIIHADVVTTVSRAYAKEILTEEFGCGLEEVLLGKEARIFGILNGIDVIDESRYMTLPNVIKAPYQFAESQHVLLPENLKILPFEEAKKANKIALQKKLKLKVNASIPMIAFVGRLDARQKGIDLLHKMLRRIDLEKYQFIVLGTGDVEWEERFKWFNKFYPKSISCTFKFEDSLAHQIYAASDFIMIPSRFEPCGLIQMIAMLYGTLPIAHRTGGMIDSVKNGVDGFLFDEYSSHRMEAALVRATEMWRNDKGAYREMTKAAMQKDFSWDVSARRYIDLYNKMLSGIE